MTEPDIASKIDRQRLAAYERLRDINADLLAALEALTQGYQYLSNAPPSQKELWDNAFAAVAKAKGVKE